MLKNNSKIADKLQNTTTDDLTERCCDQNRKEKKDSLV